ncbi:MAG: 4Fe-4S dicluster domain-containing protein [Nitrospirae bacterium]|nr:4Fe-4S dicluster domain-containing protein [Nitrospirota bacterium]MDA8339949.1 4Fe-4S dicluster domain-containing protein [Nitrospiraceae bacterium]
MEERCLACGNCTNVCPTCYCFDIIDEIELDMKTGRRYRRWDSCQLEPFAKVAGGENFRKERSARQRHRYYRKFRYPVSKFARFFCTGCGRCSRTCMAKINLKDVLSALLKEMDSSLWKR